MSSIVNAAAISAIQKNYRTHYIRSWYEYQRVTPSHLHSIEHYNAACEEHASLYEKHIMVLRDNVQDHWMALYDWMACPELRRYGWIRRCPHRKEIHASRRKLILQGYR